MAHIYKEGDRVRLLTDGGYNGSPFSPGALGTVHHAAEHGDADVVVDGDDRPLRFYSHEIEPTGEAKDHLGDVVPDLLEALESAATALEWARFHLSEAGVESGQVSGTIPEIRAAIARAKGKA